MDQIPDAPWIREAENNGVPPHEEPPVCPVCECSCKTIWKDKWNQVVGCNVCMESRDAFEWWEEEVESRKPGWVDA